MTVIGYIRVSSDKQDLRKQEHLLLKYGQQHGLHIDEFIKVGVDLFHSSDRCSHFEGFEDRTAV